jgi:hypothetical protein
MQEISQVTTSYLNDYEALLIAPENESKLWERRQRRDVGVAPTKMLTALTEIKLCDMTYSTVPYHTVLQSAFPDTFYLGQ